jgi:hypothetical protein
MKSSSFHTYKQAPQLQAAGSADCFSYCIQHRTLRRTLTLEIQKMIIIITDPDNQDGPFRAGNGMAPFLLSMSINFGIYSIGKGFTKLHFTNRKTANNLRGGRWGQNLTLRPGPNPGFQGTKHLKAECCAKCAS